MKKIALFLHCILFSYLAVSNHIIGGEVEFITLEPGTYRINLIQYWDLREREVMDFLNDPAPEFYVFSNKDDRFITSLSVIYNGFSEVEFSNTECAIEELETVKVLYTQDFELDPENFQDPEGYYLVFERCCRNATVKNIVNPVEAGISFMIEIPPLWKNDEPFINSSPGDMKPLRDYACIDQLYYADFSGTDPDGDSLSYELVTPLNSSGGIGVNGGPDPIPEPQPKPKIPVVWAADFTLEEAIIGNPPLKIDFKGFLQVKPRETGLYVFGVLVKEWRDGIQIGQVRRDFQMLVIDGCDPPDPPRVAVKIPGDDSFDPEVDTLKYSLADDKCFEFVVSNIAFGENISMRAVVVNVNENLDYLFDLNEKPVNDQESIGFDFCAPGCPPIDEPFIVDFIASDNACPVPQVDTLRMTIEIEPPPNTLPILTGVDAQYNIMENDVSRIAYRVVDNDDDSVALKLSLPDERNPEDFGLSINVIRSEPGLQEGEIIWDANCRIFNYTSTSNFDLIVTPEDYDDCEFDNPNSLTVGLSVDLPINTAPQLSLTDGPQITVRDGERISLDVLVNDPDRDSVTLVMEGVGFNPEAIGVSFNDTIARGNISESFEWTVDCSTIEGLDQRTFEFKFTTEDIDRCRNVNRDEASLTLDVLLDENDQPQFRDYPDTIIDVNKTLELDIAAFDPNPEDELTIDWFNPARLPQSESLFFESVSGNSEVHSKLTWTPDCSMVDFGVAVTYYNLVFLAYDDGCPGQKLDTMQMTIGIRNGEDRQVPFRPPNVFTPNGDGVNDVFTLTNLDNRASNMPADECGNSFLSVDIFDRNGSTVYGSNDREFAWDGGNYEPGMYYYLLKYEQQSYKGYIQLIR